MQIIGSPTCQNCKHVASIQDGRGGQVLICRRYPPQTAPIEVQDNQGRVGYQFPAAFPNVMPDWACGEHAKKILTA